MNPTILFTCCSRSEISTVFFGLSAGNGLRQSRLSLEINSEHSDLDEIFYTLKEAQTIIEHWRQHYNTKRPHSALGYRPPAPEVVLPNELKEVMEAGQMAA